MTTETRTFVGETGMSALDEMDGFRVGLTYQLHVEYRKDGNVGIKLNQHEHLSLGVRLLVMTSEEWGKWFKE